MSRKSIKYTYEGPVDPTVRKRMQKAALTKTERKSRASRDNGLLGGRPKKNKFKVVRSLDDC
ncbi:Uncharacterised protein [uncultured archaeon]|nr:Uncharacterised protein [uncultured archaeon]